MTEFLITTVSIDPYLNQVRVSLCRLLLLDDLSEATREMIVDYLDKL